MTELEAVAYAQSEIDTACRNAFAHDVLQWAIECPDDGHIAFMAKCCQRAVQLARWRDETLRNLETTFSLAFRDCGPAQ